MFKIPGAIDYVLAKLEQNGFEAYVVGGCVRDMIMGKEPHDYDITTNALPEQVMEVFKDNKVIETGLKHGTVTVLYNELPIEITTYRVDGQYSDNRRPDNVSFTSSLKEDLARRDFTINAMAYNPRQGLVDYFEGCIDIERKVIRCVGEPDERFQEDALRILRAMRFASILDFGVVVSTYNAIMRNKSLLQNISMERINSEFCKMICGRNADEVLTTYYEVIAEFIPEILSMIKCEQQNPYHVYDVWYHTMEAVRVIEPDVRLKLVMFFHDIGKPACKFIGEDGFGHFYGHPVKSAELTEQIMRRLKFDNATREFVVNMVENHDMEFTANMKHVKKYLNQFGYDGFEALLKIRVADKLAQSDLARAGYFDKLSKIKALVKEIQETEACFKLKDLKINGFDIQQLGLPAGKLIGLILGYLLQQVIEDNIPNKHEVLVQKATEYIKEMKGLQK